MNKLILSLVFLCVSVLTIAQTRVNTVAADTTSSKKMNGFISGQVLSSSSDIPLQNVNILNLSNFKGATTTTTGKFEIRAAVNDTLYFSYLGYKSLKVRVSQDWITYGDVKVKMTEVGIALEEVVVKEIELTGYLEIDAKRIPIYTNQRYSISGLNSGYEIGGSKPSAISKVLSSIFNPADFLYNIFSRKKGQLRKLRQMKEDDKVRTLLERKFDRETLSALLQIERVDIDAILKNCSYSEKFIMTANDLQILDAISECYEEYRVLQQD
ncbi:carboxypeptidase-like regulatory domain-containing protein [Dokdonia sp. Hel_I_53]|uniref:carboxypeptidase-like regulatory domain-containing protein n=1 Tax=Dokdonia sp. Hel_I_53 TaxID=1566287 RepID=UPI00119C430A|nr:carboxypeptidase-like regulatory domain-containing protein [Dokdonia sp. Hel_I_53]TVZ51512.1 carboxypeptidase-like protein [Dokdonia sp. Hel_I_53]